NRKKTQERHNRKKTQERHNRKKTQERHNRKKTQESCRRLRATVNSCRAPVFRTNRLNQSAEWSRTVKTWKLMGPNRGDSRRGKAGAAARPPESPSGQQRRARDSRNPCPGSGRAVAEARRRTWKSWISEGLGADRTKTARS